MDKTKVTLSLDEETWRSFKMHCIKNRVIASDMVNDWMASVTGKRPRKYHFDIKWLKKTEE